LGTSQNTPLYTAGLPAGTYTLTVDGSGATTGIYSFRLLDLDSATLLAPGTPQTGGTLSPGNETDVYKFSATAGDSFYFDSLTAISGVNWYLIDPAGVIRFAEEAGPGESRNQQDHDDSSTCISHGTSPVLNGRRYRTSAAWAPRAAGNQRF